MEYYRRKWLISRYEPTDYIVTVTDTNGCSDIQTIDVENPDPISFNYTVSSYNGSNISCTDSTDGFIDVLISGGNGINTS